MLTWSEVFGRRVRFYGRSAKDCDTSYRCKPLFLKSSQGCFQLKQIIILAQNALNAGLPDGQLFHFLISGNPDNLQTIDLCTIQWQIGELQFSYIFYIVIINVSFLGKYEVEKEMMFTIPSYNNPWYIKVQVEHYCCLCLALQK